MNCKFILLALGLFLWSYSAPSLALLPIVYDPYDVFQNTITAKNSVQTLINQAKQLQLDIQNVKKLSKGQLDTAGSLIEDLTALSRQGNALSYGVTNIESVFKQTFPGLTESKDYSNDMAGWSAVTYDTLKNAMVALSLQGKSLNNENADIKNLQALSDNASGNLEAHQTSHRIALEEIGQLQKLRQLLLTQGSVQNTFMTYQLQKEQAQHIARQTWIKNSQIAFHPYDDRTGFGAHDIPMP